MASAVRHSDPSLPSAGWTYEKLLSLPDDGRRYEIVDGELWLMTAPSLPHQIAVSDLQFALRLYLRPRRDVVCLSAPCDLPISATTVFQPDILVASRPTSQRFAPGQAKHVLLTVEVLSYTTAHRDRGVKRERYLGGGVSEYWIVDLNARHVERWTPGLTHPVVVREELTWCPPGAAEAFRLHLPTFFSEARAMIDAPPP